MTPTERSLKRLRDQGYLAAVVEKFNHYAGPPHMKCAGCGKNRVGVRQDLFGVFDILAAHKDFGTIAVQTTSGSGMSARRRKLQENPANVAICIEAGWRIELHGWTPHKMVKGGTRSRIDLRRELILWDDDKDGGLVFLPVNDQGEPANVQAHIEFDVGMEP